jgi:hypothetical protein
MIKHFFEFLTKYPTIGAVSGLSSGVFLTVRNLIMDEQSLKLFAGVGIYLGVAVALLTFVLKFIELLQKLRVLEMLQKIRKITFKNRYGNQE